MSALTGSIAPSWKTALPDWKERIMAGRSLVPNLPLFQSEADRALRIFKRLRIPDIAGTPTMEEACGEWYFPIVAAVMGSYDPVTARRMLQEFFLLVPKGNSKSSYGGPLMLTATIMNRRPKAGFSFIAPTIKVAEIAFDQTEGTIRLDPELEKLFHIQRHIRTITNRATGAELKIKAADTDVVTGGKDVGTMIDETHVFAERSNAAAVFVEIRGALGKRKDGFLIQTTTQSKKPPAGQFLSELKRARRVRDGETDLPLLPILYEYPEEIAKKEPWRDRSKWGLVNPNMGLSIDDAFLERELGEAEEEGKDKLLLFVSQHFNIQIGMMMNGDRWRGADFWEAAGFEQIRDLEVMLARCEVAVVGIDAGGLDDLTGLAVIGRDKRTKVWLIWNHGFAHRKILKLRPENAPRLLDFEKDGDLTFWGDADVSADVKQRLNDDGDEVEFVERPVSVGIGADIEGIVRICVKVRDSGLMPEDGNVLVDPASMGMILDALQAEGFTVIGQVDKDGGDIWSIPQSATNLFSAINTLERLLEEGSAAHGGTQIMAWCVSNAKAEMRGNAVAITKAAAGKAKIDLFVATIVAAKRMEQNPQAFDDGGESVYEALARQARAAAA